MIKSAQRKGKKGQGMVEYAGALLVATAIVVGLIATAPGLLDTLFSDTVTKVTTDLGV
jgi:hypothetical protein